MDVGSATRGLVRALFEEAGFGDVRELHYREERLPELKLVEVREDSVFCEADRAPGLATGIAS